MKQGRAEFPFKVLQAYNKQSMPWWKSALVSASIPLPLLLLLLVYVVIEVASINCVGTAWPRNWRQELLR